MVVRGSREAVRLRYNCMFACRIACYYLEEYETALQALEQGMALSPETSAFKTWHRKCKAEIEGTFLPCMPRPSHRLAFSKGDFPCR